MRRVISARNYPATIASAVEHETVIRKSRFLTRIEPVSSVEQADTVIAAIRKRAWDANPQLHRDGDGSARRSGAVLG